MGRDKAFIEVDGVPLWQRQLRILQQLAPTEILLAAPPRAEWKDSGCTIISDAQNNSGPMAGLTAALRRSSTDLLLVLAVDLPQITSAYLRMLLALCDDGKGAVPVSERFEPLVAVYPRASLRIAEQFLSSGRFSMQSFAACCVADGLMLEQPIKSSEAALFRNMNTPSDLAAIAG